MFTRFHFLQRNPPRVCVISPIHNESEIIIMVNDQIHFILSVARPFSNVYSENITLQRYYHEQLAVNKSRFTV